MLERALCQTRRAYQEWDLEWLEICIKHQQRVIAQIAALQMNLAAAHTWKAACLLAEKPQ